MVKQIILGILITLVIIPGVLAIDTQVNVRTLADHKVSIFVMESNRPEIKNSFYLDSGAGEISAIYSGSEDIIDIRVKVTKDGQTVLNEKFDEFNAGVPVYLQLIPGDISKDYKKLDSEKATVVAENASQAVENASKNESASTIGSDNSNESTKKDGVTGLAISEGKFKFSNATYFVVGGIVIALVIVLLIFKVGIPKMGGKRDMAFNYKPINPTDLDREILSAEHKIKEAKAELSRYRNKEKIESVKKSIEDQKLMLEKLEKGDI